MSLSFSSLTIKVYAMLCSLWAKNFKNWTVEKYIIQNQVDEFSQVVQKMTNFHDKGSKNLK